MPPIPADELGRILVVRNDRLGDVVLILPFLEALQQALPEAQIDVLVRPETADVFFQHPIVRAVLPDEGEPAGELAVKIRAGAYDAIIVLNPTWRNGWAAWRSGIPMRVGQGNRAFGLFFNRRVYFHRSRMEKHEAEYHLLYLEGLGIVPPPVLPLPRMIVDPQAEEEVANSLAQAGWDGKKPLVGLHPGSGGSSRTWGLANYTALAGLLLASGYTVVVTGGANEADAVELGKQPGIISIEGKTNLRELIALLAKLRVFVSADTGPMHLCGALGTPTVSIFSPQRGNSPQRWHPLGNRWVALKPEGVECGKCGRDACPDPNCMARVSVDEVFAAIKEVLSAE
jgi:lipopolysaccharide heptosyltransferase II